MAFSVKALQVIETLVRKTFYHLQRIAMVVSLDQPLWSRLKPR
jgi:hypothetical protein